jgi:hypothetical protein
MSAIALVRHVSAPLPAGQHVRSDRPRVEPEQVEEVWDAELVDELAPPAWLGQPAVSSYLRAGTHAPVPRIDVFA